MSGAGTFFSKVLSRFQTRQAPAASPESPVPSVPTVPPPAPVEPPAPAIDPVPDEVTAPAPAAVREEPAPAAVVVALPPPAATQTAQRVLKSTGPRRVATTLQSSRPEPAPIAQAPAQTYAPEPYDPVREAALQALEADLLTLCNLTGGTLVRAKRPPAAARNVTLRRHGSLTTATNTEGGEGEASEATNNDSAQSVVGPLETGIELAQTIEQRTRGMLLETSLTRLQHARIERIQQSVVDLVCALRAARYAWQISQILPLEGPSGRALMPRVRRVVEHTIEMSSRVTSAIEGREGAASAVAEHYRAFLTVKSETSSHFADIRESGSLSQGSRRLVRAALLSLTVAAESLAKVAARFALPLGTSRQITQHQQNHYRHLDRGDDLLAPLPRR